MRRKILTSLLISLVLAGCSATPINYGFEDLQSGLEFNKIQVEGKNFVLLKVDPTKLDFSIFTNKDKKNAKSIKQIYQENKLTVALNGTYFTPEFKSLGFLFSNNEELQKKSDSKLLNGFFFITNENSPAIIKSSENLDESKIKFAIQAGPILFDKSNPNLTIKETNKLDPRTTIGVTKDGHVLIIIVPYSFLSDKNSISLAQFSEIIKSSKDFQNLNLEKVINLDGGTSTGMILATYNLPELNFVQNIIGIKSH